MEIVIDVKAKLKEQKMSQKTLAELTGLREATISEIINNRRSTINRKHLGLILDALKIKDMNEVITIAYEKK